MRIGMLAIKSNNLILASFFSAVLFSGTAFADFYECNGVWQNNPCTPAEGGDPPPGSDAEAPGYQDGNSVPNSVPTAVSDLEIDLPPPTATPIDAVPYAERLGSIRSLDRTNKAYAAKGGIVLSKSELQNIKSTCENRSRDFKECQDLISAANTKLAELNLKKEQNDIETERNVIERLKVDRRR